MNHDRLSKKDILIVLVFFILLALEIVYQVVCLGITDVGNLLNSAILFFLGFVGFEDLASIYNWDILVPDFYIDAVKAKDKERVSSLAKQYFQSDLSHITAHHKEETDFILSKLDITSRQFDELRRELISLRCCSVDKVSDAEKLVRNWISDCAYPNIVRKADVRSTEYVYRDCDYYINFYPVMFDAEYRDSFAAALVTLIYESGLTEKDFDTIVVPHNGNLLLAVDVGRKLQRRVVFMRRGEGRVLQGRPWDGELRDNDKIIIVHDVLVTGGQIIYALTNLPRSCNVLGLFCLVERTEKNGKRRVRTHSNHLRNAQGMKIESLISVKADDIRALRGDLEK